MTFKIFITAISFSIIIFTVLWFLKYTWELSLVIGLITYTFLYTIGVLSLIHDQIKEQQEQIKFIYDRA